MGRRKISGTLTPANELGGSPDVGSPVMDKPLPDLRKLLALPRLEDSIPPKLRATTEPINLTNVDQPAATGDVRVTMLKDTALPMRDLFFDVHVAGPDWEERAFAQLLVRGRCKKAKSPEKADLIVFTGGADVDPALYGEERHKDTHVSKKRDDDDMALYIKALELGIPMLGICRGAQFIHVMNGGKLYQDVDNHNGEHCMWDIRRKIKIDRVSSVHHQMVIPQAGSSFQLIGTANVARERWHNPTECTRGTKIDVEAFFYRDSCAIGIQGHPEYKGYNKFAQWTLETLDDFIACNPDLEWRDGNRRLKKEFMDERDARLKKAAGVLI